MRAFVLRYGWRGVCTLNWFDDIFYILLKEKKTGKKNSNINNCYQDELRLNVRGEPSDVLFLIIICNDYSYHCSNDLRNTKSIGERTTMKKKKKTRQFLNSIVMIFMIIESNKKIVECAGCFCFATPKNQFQKINKKIIMDKNE
jgi:hypothetical protein